MALHAWSFTITFSILASIMSMEHHERNAVGSIPQCQDENLYQLYLIAPSNCNQIIGAIVHDMQHNIF